MNHWRQISPLLVCLTLFAAGSHAQLRGVVVDTTGATVSAAQVVFTQGGRSYQMVTSADGNFRFDASGTGTLKITAVGFIPTVQEVSTANEALRITLVIQPLTSTVTVSSRGIETPLSEAQQSVLVVGQEQVRESPAFALDETLRQAPGFSLFRRSGSLTANPTSQGVSLRGIGASGASRALVLLDGVPLNDAFGGWVYWGRVPRLAIQQVEVLEGGASQLYGSTALAGVVNVTTTPRTLTFAVAELSGDTYSSPQGSFTASLYRDGWGIRGSVAGYSTSGYIPTVAAQRGRVDVRAASENRLANLELTRDSSWGEFSLSGTYYKETRENGTPLQNNSTQLGEGRLRWQRPVGTGRLAMNLFGNGQSYDQTFSAIAADRNTESLTRDQHVPSQRLGGSVVWAATSKGLHNFSLGFDAQSVRGFSQEVGFSGGAQTVQVSAGGEQRSFGLFAQDSLRVGTRLLLTLGLRGDHWTNTDARSISQPTSTGVTTTSRFPTTTETFLSPRISGLVRFNDHVAGTFSVHRAFRAPTLNELYRGFRLGNVQTNANASLSAEALTGGEAGIVWSWDSLSLRTTGFLYEIREPIANVTRSVTPSLILRERRNLGRNQVVGMEWTGNARLARHFEVRAAYQFAASTVEIFPANRALEGLQTPQVPRHSFTFSTVWQPSVWSLQFQGRLNGNQFDDDQNLLPLGKAALLDASVARTWGGRFRTFLAVQNLVNDRYAIALTPVRQVGPAVVLRAGIRMELKRGERP